MWVPLSWFGRNDRISGKVPLAGQNLELRRVGDGKVHRSGNEAVAVNVVMYRFGLFNVSTVSDYDPRPQGSTQELPRPIGVNLAYAKRIVGITMDDKFGATREV